MAIFDQRPNSRGFSGRFIVAIVIALIGFFMYISHREENPVTGKKQYVAIHPNQEIRLGLESAPVMSKKMGGELSSSNPKTQLVKKTGQFIVNNSDAKNGPWQFEFHLLADDQTVNAFALPGGQIFITLGLFDRLKNEGQLVGVLSHEIGHVIERHTAQQMAKSQLGQSLVMAVGTAASSDQSSGAHAAMVASLVNQMFQLRYSRKDESEADLWGVKLMSQVGYNPEEMIEVLKILKASGGSRGQALEIFQTHPNPDLRIEHIEEFLKANPNYAKGKKGKSIKEILRF